MDVDRVLHHLLRELDKLVEEQQSFLGSGSAKDFAEYRYVCGTIRGLGHAEILVRDLVHRLEIDDE
jgi:hypothetical protein